MNVDDELDLLMASLRSDKPKKPQPVEEAVEETETVDEGAVDEAAEELPEELVKELAKEQKPKAKSKTAPKKLPAVPDSDSLPSVTQKVDIDIANVLADHMSMVRKIQKNVDEDRHEIQKTITICLDQIEQDPTGVKSVYVEALVTAQTAKVNAQTVSLKTLDSITKLLSAMKAIVPQGESKRTVRPEDLQLPPVTPDEDGA